MSPLWALYPGNDITPADTNLFAAAKVLLEWRGDGSTGWSYAWRMGVWARAGDGNYAFRQLNSLFQRKTLSNLFDLCGPFQIDGNFGTAAGIAEMLLQSHQVIAPGEKAQIRILDLLPALPKAWPDGCVTGLCARGGFVVDLNWRDGALTQVNVFSRLVQSCHLYYANREVELTSKPREQFRFNGRFNPIK
jgi:alpha-L-fucosidase 2